MSLPPPEEWPTTHPVAYPTRDLLRVRAEATPDATALVDADTGVRWRYEDLDRHASERLAGLQAVADAAGGRIGLLLDTGRPFVECYFATARAGGTLVPLNVGLDDQTLATQARRGDLDVLVCDSTTEERALEVAPDGVPVVSVDEPTDSSVERLERVDGARRDSVEVSRDDVRLILFTSGTTGDPKGVRITLGNLVSSAVGSADRLDVSPDDRWLVCLPTYHMGGFAPLFRSTLYGTTVVLQREFDTADTAAVMDDRDVTCVSLVPTMLTRLLDDGWTPPDGLRFVLLGGAPASTRLLERCEERGVPVCPTYGATETASQVATALPETAFSHPGTVGEPLRETTVVVRDEDGERCGPEEVGEIVVDGPTVTPGYLSESQTVVAFGDNGFETGDLGYRDEAGRLWVVGRVDDQIVTGGENVRPGVVEDRIRDVPGVADVVVLGLPDEEWGERVAALVEPIDDSLSGSDVVAACRDDLADFAVPKAARVVESLPRTDSGTVDREAARRVLADE